QVLAERLAYLLGGCRGDDRRGGKLRQPGPAVAQGGLEGGLVRVRGRAHRSTPDMPPMVLSGFGPGRSILSVATPRARVRDRPRPAGIAAGRGPWARVGADLVPGRCPPSPGRLET